jgi:pimeloyl-ACP methyl ester carboxylesterase
MITTPAHPLTEFSAAGVSGLMRDGDPQRTVIFLHGIGGRAGTFAPLFAHLPPGPRLIAWDAPGYGQSTALSEPWPEVRDYAARLDDLRVTLNQTPVDIVGHSLGSLIAGHYAAHFGSHVRKLVLMAPAPGYRIARGSDLPTHMAQRIDAMEKLGPAQFADQRARNLVHKADQRSDTLAFVRSAMASVSIEGYAQAVRMLASADLLTDAAAITAPTLVISGADDQVTPLEGTRRVHAAIAGLADQMRRLEVVADAGHAVSIEQPALVAQLISQFLEGS